MHLRPFTQPTSTWHTTYVSNAYDT